jgi:two-component system response regulator
MAMAAPPFDILLVEDNPADVRLTQEAFKDTRVPNRLHVARDGVEALGMLRDATGAVPRPDLILLDLNLPRKDGREVLQDIKQDEALRHIPVVVLSTSHSEHDVARSYRLGANAFVTKPVDVDRFFQVIRALEQFWLDTARLIRP